MQRKGILSLTYVSSDVDRKLVPNIPFRKSLLNMVGASADVECYFTHSSALNPLSCIRCCHAKGLCFLKETLQPPRRGGSQTSRAKSACWKTQVYMMHICYSRTAVCDLTFILEHVAEQICGRRTSTVTKTSCREYLMWPPARTECHKACVEL